MARLVTAALLLLSALSASAQSPSSSSAQSSASSSAASAASSATGTSSAGNSTASTAPTAPQNVTVFGEVGAQANATETPFNGTMQSVWSTESSRGTLAQGLTLLQNSSGTAANQSVFGVFLYYDEETALRNANASATTEIPWIAYISCDEPTQSVSVPADEAISLAEAFGDAVEVVPVNGTASNGTQGMQLQGNVTAGLFAQAEAQGASGVLLYSTTQQSCSLNYTILGNSTNTSLPIFSTPSRNVANLVISQFQNVAEDHRTFNASLLNAATGNLSAIIGANAGSNLTSFVLSTPSNFILARLVPSYAENDSSNGVVATIGRAPTKSATGSVAPSPTDGGGSGSGGTSGASPRRSRTSLAVTGFVVGGLIAGVGLLV
ncbi:hypothetical protein JCM10449v2_006113 [Rhodotorula kratochvilovae]